MYVYMCVYLNLYVFLCVCVWVWVWGVFIIQSSKDSANKKAAIGQAELVTRCLHASPVQSATY